MNFLDSLLESPASTGVWRWYRVVATGVAVSFLLLFAKAAWVNFADPRVIDFISFWAAGRLAVEGHAPLAYDVVAQHQVEFTAVGFYGLLPFPYPPPFLLLVLPFGIPPYWLAFPLWVIATGLLYVVGSRLVSSVPVAMAHPAVFLNSIQGQNGFLTCGIFMVGANLLSTAPFFAGAIWGLLVMKPQLALLLPVALIAGREWKAVAGCALSAIALSIVALLSLGADAYRGFFNILPLYADWMSTSQWSWSKLASAFAFLRYFDMPQATALAIHAAVALAAAVLTWRAWARGIAERIAVLATATLLVSPYTLTYDSLLLLAPLAWLMKERRQPYVVAAVWLLLLPVGLFNGLYHGPNTVPVACILCLWALHRQPASSEEAVPATAVG